MCAQLLFWVVPLVEGQLVIEGIGFKLCGMLWGQSNFINLHKCFVGGSGGGQLHSSTAGAGYSSLSVSSSASPPASEPSSPADNNAIHVVGAMPLIEVRTQVGNCVSSCVCVCGRC
jgi:hypothetical protein